MEEAMINIKVLGPGCSNCKRLEMLVRQAVANLSIEATVEKITDFAEIMKYPLLGTPGNVRSAYLHVLGDVISSVGVIIAAIVIWQTGWAWADPVMSVLIGIIILISSWRVLKSSLHIFMEGVPEGISVDKVARAMSEVEGVNEVHDLHVWSLCSGHVSLSAHVVTDDNCMDENASLMTFLKQRLSAFGIEHTTIQFECDTCGQGRVYLAPEHASV
jgi:cobalt-zinc-cadmium efflux system protein